MGTQGLPIDLQQRLRGDLVADAGDLALARVQVERRRWLLQALSQVLSGGVPPSQPPDSLVRMEEAAALIEAAGRGGGGALRWDPPLEAPLRNFVGSPQFDIADDTFQEMLATSAFRTLRDSELRSAILAYYRTAEDMADALDHNEASVDRFTALLLESSVSIGDSLNLEQLAAVAHQDPRLSAQGREALFSLGMQALPTLRQSRPLGSPSNRHWPGSCSAS